MTIIIENSSWQNGLDLSMRCRTTYGTFPKPTSNPSKVPFLAFHGVGNIFIVYTVVDEIYKFQLILDSYKKMCFNLYLSKTAD